MHEAAEDEAELDGKDVAAGGEGQQAGLNKVLTGWDVLAYGIGSTVGAGIFAITGNAAVTAGPAIVLSFILAAVACLFSAFSYMEFAARLPISGSAYSFAYTSMGELMAWFVGWNLTLEYAISAAVVARTWANNLEFFLQSIGANYPTWLSSIHVEGGFIDDISIMSAVICLVCMGILLVGVKESSRFNMFITCLNISVIVFIVALGAFHTKSENWTAPDPAKGPHAPKSYFPAGINGIVTGAATVFFSYIGFDAVTTLAEEVKNPKRDVPLGIIGTLIISTSLYIATSVVITGMRPWYELNSRAPLADAFTSVGVSWAATLISAATVVALTGNTLTSLFGQPRVFYRMARDGLLFKAFAKVHPTTKAPLWGTLISGVGAALIALLIPLNSLSEMISIGTLLAFSTVCAGVVILRYERPPPAGSVGAIGGGVSGEDGQRLLAPGADVDTDGRPASVHIDDLSGGASPHERESDSPYSPLPSEGGAGFSALSSSAEADALEPNPSLWRRLRSNVVFWLFVYLFPCTGFCASLRHTDTCPWPVIVLLGLVSCVPVWLISRLPLARHNTPKPGNFVCPLVPFLPCAGIFTNIYLVTSLDVWSYVRVAVWTALGMMIYFGYGVVNSTIVESMAKFQAFKERERLSMMEHQRETSANGDSTLHVGPAKRD